MDNDADVAVDSPDTDVLFLLINMFQRLPAAIKFRTGKGKLRRSIAVKPIYNILGEKRASAITGFHSFMGCDMICQVDLLAEEKTGVSKSLCHVTIKYWMLWLL